jgi:hypothetical protein
MRFSAAAKYSSLNERTLEPRGAEMRSTLSFSGVLFVPCQLRKSIVPVYCDLKVASIWSAGIERAAVVATLFTSSGVKVRISIFTGKDMEG